jgi:hypothetical protein
MLSAVLEVCRDCIVDFKYTRCFCYNYDRVALGEHLLLMKTEWDESYFDYLLEG